jgi:hypothetical protein
MAGFQPFWPDGRNPAGLAKSGQIGRRNLADRIPAKVAEFRRQIPATLTDVGF